MFVVNASGCQVMSNVPLGDVAKDQTIREKGLR